VADAPGRLLTRQAEAPGTLHRDEALLIHTFGCQMNQHDSERIGEVLRAAGYRDEAEPARADLIVLNTCSVREKAEQKLRSARRMRAERRRGGLRVAVAGRMVQEHGDALLERLDGRR
jgi:tRNA-2-methylthio-N6-dimethylallyladenosine synthase